MQIGGLKLNGALTISGNKDLEPNLVVRNKGCPVVSIPPAELKNVAEGLKIRGYWRDPASRGEIKYITVSGLSENGLTGEPFNQDQLFKGSTEAEKRQLFAKVSRLDRVVPGGGLEGYLVRARKLFSRFLHGADIDGLTETNGVIDKRVAAGT